MHELRCCAGRPRGMFSRPAPARGQPLLGGAAGPSTVTRSRGSAIGGRMDAGYVSAIAALTGSVIGGLTSLAASWLTQHAQFKAQQFTHDVGRREELYRDFIEEASRLF